MSIARPSIAGEIKLVFKPMSALAHIIFKYDHFGGKSKKQLLDINRLSTMRVCNSELVKVIKNGVISKIQDVTNDCAASSQGAYSTIL